MSISTEEPSKKMAEQPRITTVKETFEGELVEGTMLKLCGWVRSKRTSKGGFSFVHLNDGSCLSNLQVVADSELENYESEIEKLGVGSVSYTHLTLPTICSV